MSAVSWRVRQTLAGREDLPPELIERLALDPDYGVRLAVAGRPNLPERIRAHLRGDRHPLVAARRAPG